MPKILCDLHARGQGDLWEAVVPLARNQQFQRNCFVECDLLRCIKTVLVGQVPLRWKWRVQREVDKLTHRLASLHI